MTAVIVGFGQVARRPTATKVPRFETGVPWFHPARLHRLGVESLHTRAHRPAAIAVVIAMAIGASPRVLAQAADDLKTGYL